MARRVGSDITRGSARRILSTTLAWAVVGGCTQLRSSDTGKTSDRSPVRVHARPEVRLVRWRCAARAVAVRFFEVQVVVVVVA